MVYVVLRDDPEEKQELIPANKEALSGAGPMTSLPMTSLAPPPG